MKNKNSVKVTAVEYAIACAPAVERVALYAAMFAAVWGITVLVAVVVPAVCGFDVGGAR